MKATCKQPETLKHNTMQSPNSSSKYDTVIHYSTLARLMPRIYSGTSDGAATIKSMLHQLEKKVIWLHNQDLQNNATICGINSYTSRGKKYQLSMASWEILNGFLKDLVLTVKAPSAHNARILPTRKYKRSISECLEGKPFDNTDWVKWENALESSLEKSRLSEGFMPEMRNIYKPARAELTRLLCREIIKSYTEPLFEFQLHWNLSKGLVRSFFDSLNSVELLKSIYLDLQHVGNWLYFGELLRLAKPKHISSVNLCNRFSLYLKYIGLSAHKDLAATLLFYSIYTTLRENIIPFEKLRHEPHIINLLLANKTDLCKLTGYKGPKISTRKKEDTNTQTTSTDNPDLHYLRFIFGRVSNILNVYLKGIGIDICSFLLSDTANPLYTKELVPYYSNSSSTPKSAYQIKFNAVSFHFPLSRDIPDIIPVNSNKDGIKTYSVPISLGVVSLRKLRIHPKEFMFCELHNQEKLLQSRVSYQFNYDALNTFFKRLALLIKVKRSFTHFQVSFLSNIYDVNFLALKPFPLVYLALLRYAIEYSTIVPFNIFVQTHKFSTAFYQEYKTVNKTLVDHFVGKIINFKIILSELFFVVCILKDFKNFTFDLFLDMRGRIYPATSSFNYLRPLLRNFITFATTDDNVPLTEVDNIIKPVVQQTVGQFKITSQQLDSTLGCFNILRPITVENVHLYFFGSKNTFGYNIPISKLFDLYVNIREIQRLLISRQLQQKAAVSNFVRSQDSSSNGLQVIALLLRDPDLARLCGLTYAKDKDGNNVTLDVYSVCLEYFENVERTFINCAEFLSQFTEFRDKCVHFLTTYCSYCSFATVTIATPVVRSLHEIYILIRAISATDLTQIVDLFTRFSPGFSATQMRLCLGIIKNTPTTDVSLLQFSQLSKPALEQSLNLIGKLLNLYYILTLTSKMLPFRSLVNRQLMKMPIMTTFYGASSKTREKQFVNSLVEQAIARSLYVTDLNVITFRKYAQYLSLFIVTWLKNCYPQALILLRSIQLVTSPIRLRTLNLQHYLFVPQVISTPEHCSWFFHPLRAERYSKSIHNHDYKLHYLTDDTDYLVLRRAFLANYIQFIDAVLARKFLDKFASRNLSAYTIHDCFRTNVANASVMDDILKECYAEVFSANYLEVHFSKTNPGLLAIIKQYKLKLCTGELTLADLNNPNFVKF